MAYLPLLIACSKTAGSFSPSLEYDKAFDTRERFGLWIQHSPFTVTPKPKNILTQDWKDQDGEDTFIPEKIYHEPYEMELSFVYLRDDGNVDNNIREFISTIKGKWLKMYESYTQQGRQGVYLMEVEDDPQFKRRDTNNLLILKCKFKVNDPDTNIKL